MFWCSLLPDSLQPHRQRYVRLPCPSLAPWVCSNSCPLSQWCHPIISSSVASFSSCLQSFPASRSFSVSQVFASGGQSIRTWALASVLSMNIQGWFPLGLPVWSSGCSRDSQESSPAPHFEGNNSLVLSPLYDPTVTSVRDYWKNHGITPIADHLTIFININM